MAFAKSNSRNRRFQLRRNLVAAYRQSALTAFQEVEDNLAALRELETEAQQQHEATVSADRSLELFKTRYEGGVDTFIFKWSPGKPPRCKTRATT